MRDIPRNLKDEKDVENFFLALRDEAISITSHSELKNVEAIDKSSTDTKRDKHVSNYDMKKIEDHMDDERKHIGQTLDNTANYLSNITPASSKVVIASPTPTTRTIDVDPSVIVTDVLLQTSDITTNNVSTSKHGFAPKAPNDATKFLNGANPPDYTVPAGTTYTGGDNIVITGTTIDQRLERGADVYSSGAQTINDITETVIQFNNENYDLSSEYSTITYRYTAVTAGYYLVNVSVGLTAVVLNSIVSARIRKNGATIAQAFNSAGNDGSGGMDTQANCSKVVVLAVGDYIEGAIYHNHGSARNTISTATTTYMTISCIG